jgi:hypothetical protein
MRKSVSGDRPGRMQRVSFPEGRTAMTDKKEELTDGQQPAQSRSYGKFRCHNPSCMARILVEPGATHCKCPTCGLEWRVSWIAPGFPRIRGPVWDVNEKIAQEAAAKKEE